MKEKMENEELSCPNTPMHVTATRGTRWTPGGCGGTLGTEEDKGRVGYNVRYPT